MLKVSYPPPPAPAGGMLDHRLCTDFYGLHRPVDYYQPPSEYSTPSGHYADRLFPEFSSGEYPAPAYAYDNPSSSVSSSSTRTGTRQYGHRRTPSNVSNTSSCGGTATSSVNPTFSLEGEVTG